MRGKLKQTRLPYILVLPALGLILFFTLYPFGHAIYTSLHRSNPLLPQKNFVGLDNYGAVLTSYYFGKSSLNTLAFIAVTVPAITILAIAIARLLNENFWGRSILRPAVLIPWTIPGAITGIIWQWIFNDSFGALNVILYKLGLVDTYVPWLQTAQTAKFGVMVAYVWAQLPFAIILIMVALVAIPRNLYDAAMIDGAKPFQCFRHITWPHIKTMTVVVIIYESLTGLANYDITYSMTGGGPGTATSMVSYYIWSESFDQLNFDHGAALAAIIAGISLVFIFMIMKAIPSNIMLERDAG
jgi:ABC-type sugar transport system permease subunit